MARSLQRPATPTLHPHRPETPMTTSFDPMAHKANRSLAAVPARPIIPLPDAPIEYPPAREPEEEEAPAEPTEQPAEPVTVPAPAEPVPALPGV
jgi:hypothetical protein